MMGQQAVQGVADFQDFAGVDFDISSLPLIATQWLVDHDTGMRQAGTLALGATGEQKGTHAGRLANAQGRHIRFRSEEHTSELQSRPHLVCRLLLEKKKKKT